MYQPTGNFLATPPRPPARPIPRPGGSWGTLPEFGEEVFQPRHSAQKGRKSNVTVFAKK